MRRGTLLLVRSTRGAATKVRPCVVVQRTLADIDKLTVCPLTTTIHVGNVLRPTVAPSPRNGLQQMSQVETDWILTEQLRYFGRKIGELEDDVMSAVDDALRRWLAL